MLLVALGGASLHALLSGATANPRRKWVAITHGVGLLIALVGGFGLLARLGISHGADWPAWVWIKLVIWLVLGAMPALIGRSPGLAGVYWILIPLLAALAAYLAVHKPI